MYLIAVALALFLLSVCAVGTEDLQPPIYRSYKANSGGNVKPRSIIRDLLKRQSYCYPGYGYCSNRGQCCPVGGDCCNDGNCCPAGEYCIRNLPGYCCHSDQYVCKNTNCCYNSEQCCQDGGCCYPGYFCVVAPDGSIRCCPNGETCYGQGGGGGGGNGAGGGTTPPPTTITLTSTTSSSTSTTPAPATSRTPQTPPSRLLLAQLLLQVLVRPLWTEWGQEASLLLPELSCLQRSCSYYELSVYDSVMLFQNAYGTLKDCKFVP